MFDPNLFDKGSLIKKYYFCFNKGHLVYFEKRRFCHPKILLLASYLDRV